MLSACRVAVAGVSCDMTTAGNASAIPVATIQW